jgi:hypothetical protein
MIRDEESRTILGGLGPYATYPELERPSRLGMTEFLRIHGGYEIDFRLPGGQSIKLMRPHVHRTESLKRIWGGEWRDVANKIWKMDQKAYYQEMTGYPWIVSSIVVEDAGGVLLQHKREQIALGTDDLPESVIPIPLIYPSFVFRPGAYGFIYPLVI